LGLFLLVVVVGIGGFGEVEFDERCYCGPFSIALVGIGSNSLFLNRSGILVVGLCGGVVNVACILNWTSPWVVEVRELRERRAFNSREFVGRMLMRSSGLLAFQTEIVIRAI